MAGAYYWHRFFSHQPDLNFDNPEVRATMLRAVDRWLEMGVDGVRLDAVPYLFEREGTNCENLPETHAFLKELRAHVDANFPDRMLLAEANQWPEDAVAYFGDGDECHMAFHFPLMPRLFMALRMEDRFPVIDILQQTPAIPESAQWAIFLRNHDELTLEMVTDEERDYMYRAYAADPQMRVNVGIRRRLAPLLQNDRRKIELMNGLLFSLPGTPVIYYGDELGMGDNVYLGDRDGVRTPMQWSPDRNAGFSDANPQRLYLPVIIDPEYHYETVNVEAQDQNPNSLLWWMRRLIALRPQHPVFGRGEIEFLYPENAKVLAFVRRDEDADRPGRGQPVPLRQRGHPRPARVPGRRCRSSCSARPSSRRSRRARTSSPSAPTASTGSPSSRSGPTTVVAAAVAATCPVLSVASDWQTLLKGRGRAPARAGVLPELPRPQPVVRGQGRGASARSRPLDVIPVSHSAQPVAGVRAPRPRRVHRRRARDLRGPAAVIAAEPTPSSSSPTTRTAAWRGSTCARGGEPALPHDAVVDPTFMAGAARRPPAATVASRSLGNAELRASTTPWFRRVLNGAAADDLAVQHIGGRADEQLGRLRQPDGDEDVPPGPGGGEPRPRDRSVPHRDAASRTPRRCSAPSSTRAASAASPAPSAWSTPTSPTRATPGTTPTTS